ncbi:MAG: alkaline phosphatase family protein [Thermoplasmata archaeon]|nr:alkaline phosphatase family protein [Thermoplasmata archaeon]
MVPPRRRFLVLGLDGGTFDLLDPLMAAGELPFLAELAKRGLRAPLRSVFPPKTIPAWYSFATGLDPGSLGIFGFTEPNGGPGRSRLVQTFRPTEAVWDVLSRQGIKVGVMNFPLKTGYPLHGFVVPGMLSEEPKTYPADLLERIENHLGERYARELPAYHDNERSGWLEIATKAVDQRGRAAEFLCNEFAPEFLFILFRETDRVEHQHWAELAKAKDGLPEDLLKFWRSVDASCRRADEAFRAAGGPCVTLVISDHGHGAARSDFFTNRWLAERGYLVFKNGGTSWRRRAFSRMLVTADRIGPVRRLLKPIADRLHGGPKREWVSRMVAGEGSFEGMADRIDWDRTTAFSYPVPEGIYLNRYNTGLSPEKGAEIIQQIRRELLEYPEAHIEVFRPSEIYLGQNLSTAPSLLLRVDSMETELRMDFSYPSAMLRHRPGYFYGTGVHRMDGILLAGGEGVPAHREEDPLSLLDVAPTVLDGMGCPVPAGLAGRSFVERLGSAPT